MLDAKIFNRYIKVREMALRGTPQEQKNAVAIIATMEKKYPELRLAWDQYVYEQENGARTAKAQNNEYAAGFDPDEQEEGTPWDSFFSTVEEVFRQGRSFLEQAQQMKLARLLADQVKITAKVSSTSNYTITTKILADHLQHIAEFTPAQRNAYIRSVLANIEAELYGFLSAIAEEEYEDDENE